jgi:hypothetical protein
MWSQSATVQPTLWGPLAVQTPWKARLYEAIAIILAVAVSALFGTACGPGGRNQPAESQERGIENSDQPQSRQTWMSGEGVKGGWLRVRGLLR